MEVPLDFSQVREGSKPKSASGRDVYCICVRRGVHVPVAPGLAFVSTAFGDEQGTGQPSYA